MRRAAFCRSLERLPLDRRIGVEVGGEAAVELAGEGLGLFLELGVGLRGEPRPARVERGLGRAASHAHSDRESEDSGRAAVSPVRRPQPGAAAASSSAPQRSAAPRRARSGRVRGGSNPSMISYDLTRTEPTTAPPGLQWPGCP